MWDASVEWVSLFFFPDPAWFVGRGGWKVVYGVLPFFFFGGGERLTGEWEFDRSAVSSWR